MLHEPGENAVRFYSFSAMLVWCLAKGLMQAKQAMEVAEKLAALGYGDAAKKLKHDLHIKFPLN